MLLDVHIFTCIYPPHLVEYFLLYEYFILISDLLTAYYLSVASVPLLNYTTSFSVFWFITILGTFNYKTLVVNSIVFAFKFMFLIALFIFIRGGIPRYRYDFLTKVGWVKFLNMVLAFFVITLVLYLII